MDWDPLRYLSFSDERGRAFVELLARVGAEAPTTVVDLGSGPGTFTELLHKRWPHAHVIGVDSSPTMVEFATREIPGVDFVLADLHRWEPTEPIDRTESVEQTLRMEPFDLYERKLLLRRVLFSVMPPSSPRHEAVSSIGGRDIRPTDRWMRPSTAS